MIGCDLLVMDDLGHRNPPARLPPPACMSCSNTRLLAGLPTLISTNLTADQLSARYGEAITSRIIGVFRPVIFYGSDVRFRSAPPLHSVKKPRLFAPNCVKYQLFPCILPRR